MKIQRLALTKGAFFTIISFCVGQTIRFSTNVILTRILAPDLFGIMVIVNTLKSGVELITDVGIGQSVVYSKNSEDPGFYNTAWTLQALRGVILWLVTSLLAMPVAHFYHAPILVVLVPISSFIFVISGLASLNLFVAQKKLQIERLAAYEAVGGIIWAAGQVTLAYIFPTIWSLVFGLIFGSTVATIASYFILPGSVHKFEICRQYAWQIIHFGKWIFFASFIYFLSSSFDRIYLAGAIPLALLGVYGISRSIAELLSTLAAKIGNFVIFPFIASHSDTPRIELRKQLALIRAGVLVFAVFCFSLFAATVDLGIKLVFDQRYHAAGWMVPILVLGSWISILCSMNESVLLGFGKPAYGAVANGIKLVWLALALPIAFTYYGPLGSIIVVAVSDFWRYIPIFVGQIRARFSFGMQDTLVSLLGLGLFGLFEFLRVIAGLGTSLQDLGRF
jgi:O-antigen/teichoic acid export membrane protein